MTNIVARVEVRFVDGDGAHEVGSFVTFSKDRVGRLIEAGILSETEQPKPAPEPAPKAKTQRKSKAAKESP